MEQNIQGLWDNYKRGKIHLVGISEKEREKGTEEILETVMTEDFPS